MPTLVALAQNCDIVWLMVPAGDPVDSCINELLPHLKARSIVVDGGNSNYKHSERRAALLRSKGFYLIDCGTSGGTHGLEHGFCLMIGGGLSRTLFALISSPHFMYVILKLHGYKSFLF